MRIKRNFLPVSATRDSANNQPQEGILALRARLEQTYTQSGYKAGTPMCVQRLWESVCGCLVRNCVWASASKVHDCPLSLFLSLSLLLLLFLCHHSLSLLPAALWWGSCAVALGILVLRIFCLLPDLKYNMPSHNDHPTVFSPPDSHWIAQCF